MKDRKGVERGRCNRCKDCEEFVFVKEKNTCDSCGCESFWHQKVTGPVSRVEGSSKSRNQQPAALDPQSEIGRISTETESENIFQCSGDISGVAVCQNNFSHIGNLSIGCTGNAKEKTATNQEQVEREITQYQFKDFAVLFNTYQGEDSWLRPFPWDTKIQEDFYVPLAMDVYTRSGLEWKGVEADLENLFDPVLGGGDSARKVLIRGDGGQGKTTICSKIAYCWAHGETVVRALPSKSILVVLYRLRHLRQNENLETILLEYVRSHYNPMAKNENSLERVHHIIQSLGRNVLVILDGYDETDDESREQVKHLLRGRHNNPFLCSSFLVTSRPIPDTDFIALFDKQFYICQMSENRAEQLVGKFYKGNALDIDQFRRHFEYRDLTAFSTLALFIFCWIFKEGKARSVKNTHEVILEVLGF